jgi:hypothetical protein
VPVLLLVTGSLHLARNEDATHWACDYLQACVAGLPPRSHVLSGGDEGPEQWARQAAERLSIGWVEYRLDGLRHATRGERRPWAPGPADLRQQTEALLGAASASQQAGWVVRVLALLLAGQPEGRGLVSLATRAGLPVEALTYQPLWPGRPSLE